jgi:hypothetical protein
MLPMLACGCAWVRVGLRERLTPRREERSALAVPGECEEHSPETAPLVRPSLGDDRQPQNSTTAREQLLSGLRDPRDEWRTMQT